MSLDTEKGGDDMLPVEPMCGLAVCKGVSCTKMGILGAYDWKWLCTPQVSCSDKKISPPPFLSKDEQLPLLVMVIMGLQHCLAMLGGLVTVPALIAGDACFPFQYDAELCGSKGYMISASIFVSGLLTIVQVIRFKLCGKYYLGTGLLSVMGTSFTFLPIARDIVTSEIRAGRSGMDAYGAFLGTCIVAAFLEILISFIPPKVMRRAFPPVVTGTCVMLIGGSLIATGMKYWGGGVFCAENSMSRGAAFGGPQLCTGNGEVVLGYGAPEYIGLGLTVILTLILLNLMGSPFMKNCSVIISLFVGYIISAGATYTSPSGESLRYVTGGIIEIAPWVTFPWVTTFPLGFYPAAIIPILIGFVVTSIETVGDITASLEASHLAAEGPDAEARVQGGLLADALNSMIAAFMTVAPNTTFSQNNGVISLTRCASRAAGLACACWLMFFGIFGKFAGIISSIPDCVLGGMTIFLFANVFVSGINIICGLGKINRRNRFILALSLGVGLGVTAVPDFAEGGGVAAFYGGNLKHEIGLMPAKNACIVPAGPGGCVNNNGLCCFKYDTTKKMGRDTVVLIIKTPYCIGTLIALFLNSILPLEEEDAFDKVLRKKIQAASA